MTTKTGLAAVLAAIAGKQPTGDSVARGDHMTAVEAAVTQAFGEGEAAGKLAGVSEGATAERARSKAILGGENATGREALAAHFAFNTEMSAEAANAALAAAPKAAEAPAPAKSSRLDALMPGATPNLKEPGAGGTTEDLDAISMAAMDRAIKARGMSPLS